MKAKLESILKRYKEVEGYINDPEISADLKRYKEYKQEFKRLSALASAAQKYIKLVNDLESNKELIASSQTEKELKELALEENEQLEIDKVTMDDELRVLLIPKDPNDTKNCIMEIRAGTGGDEAGIFVGDLYRIIN